MKITYSRRNENSTELHASIVNILPRYCCNTVNILRQRLLISIIDFQEILCGGL